MIAIVLLIVSLLLMAATPWRLLSLDGRLWAAAALLNTMVFFALPITPATSPWRPVVARVLAGSAVASLLLVILGLILWRRHGTLATGGGPWVAPLVIGALPSAFYAFFWIVGPLY
jgi:hypothetical protein